MAHMPAAFIFENVVGLVTMDGGSRTKRKGQHDPTGDFTPGTTFTSIVDDLAACGYDVAWHVLNSREWLPQCRERVYIVGFRSDLAVLEFPWAAVREGASGQATTLRHVLEEPASAAVRACELNAAQWEAVCAQNAVYPRWGGQPCTMAERTAAIDQKVPALISSYHNCNSFTTKFVFEERDGSRRDTGERRPRFFTPRECARLMGFPGSYVVPSAEHDALLAAQWYRQIGNAVCPPVIQAIGTQVVRLLDGRK